MKMIRDPESRMVAAAVGAVVAAILAAATWSMIPFVAACVLAAVAVSASADAPLTRDERDERVERRGDF